MYQLIKINKKNFDRPTDMKNITSDSNTWNTGDPR